MVFRAINGQTPGYISELFNKSSNTHAYQTRAAISEGVIVPKARTNMGKLCFSQGRRKLIQSGWVIQKSILIGSTKS